MKLHHAMHGNENNDAPRERDQDQQPRLCKVSKHRYVRTRWYHTHSKSRRKSTIRARNLQISWKTGRSTGGTAAPLPASAGICAPTLFRHLLETHNKYFTVDFLLPRKVEHAIDSEIFCTGERNALSTYK